MVSRRATATRSTARREDADAERDEGGAALLAGHDAAAPHEPSPRLLARAASAASAFSSAGKFLRASASACAGILAAAEHGVGIDQALPAGEVAAVALEALGQAVDHLRDHAGAVLGRRASRLPPRPRRWDRGRAARACPHRRCGGRPRRCGSRPPPARARRPAPRPAGPCSRRARRRACRPAPWPAPARSAARRGRARASGSSRRRARASSVTMPSAANTADSAKPASRRTVSPLRRAARA